MLCSMCKKNTAVIFINKQGADGKAEVEGLCYECAKKKGINPIDTMAKQANLSDKDIQDLSNKLDTMFKNLSDNMADIDEDELSEMINGESEIEGAQGVPLGSIFSGLFLNYSGEEQGGSSMIERSTLLTYFIIVFSNSFTLTLSLTIPNPASICTASTIP